LFGDAGNDIIFGDADNDHVDGGKGNDGCHGGSGDDQLMGGRGADKLYGEAGNNLLDSDFADDISVNGMPVNLHNELQAAWYFSITGSRVIADYSLQNSGGELTSTFKVYLESDQNNQTFTVRLNGTDVGQMMTNPHGIGELKFSTDPSEAADPFPSGFPTLTAGSIIRIGNLTQGTFVEAHFI
jgi:Ca2+-binding RTX toxin-like protein